MEKSKQSIPDYEPTVDVTTSLSHGRLMIAIKDNGTGIPADIKGNIFNPFFTTKPTGVGAGLGLSISHDIVMAHGGTIVCETAEGTGSIFMISIPVQNS